MSVFGLLDRRDNIKKTVKRQMICKKQKVLKTTATTRSAFHPHPFRLCYATA
jgi:hypothetical protein